MRARIAGRVTPSSSQTGADALEMIELPVKFPTVSCISCCQTTGNILVGCDKWLCLYRLVSRTHDISRQRFLDFEPWPVTIELSFSPLRLATTEDVVAASDRTSLHVFRINKGFARPTEDTVKSEDGADSNTKKEPCDLDALIREVSDASCLPRQQQLLGNGPSLPVLAILPGIKSNAANNPARNLRVSPFKPPHSVTMGVAIKEVPANEPWAEKMTTMIESLLQLELGPGGPDEAPQEEFRSLILRPLYKVSAEQPPTQSEMSCPRLRSASYSNLVGFNCFVSTQQEGYLYHFPVEEGEVMSLGKCISVYSFTSGVKYVCLEPYLLHALTTTGLETYTMRSIHAVHAENDEACPPADDPVCLVGLRPFIGVVNMLLTKSFVVILTSSTESPVKGESSAQLTVYGLLLPSASNLYTDMMAVANSHRFTSSSTYYHLLAEAHAILRSVVYLSTDPETRPQQREKELYDESCALFADYYLTCDTEEDWEMGYKYCLMADLNPIHVMDRLKKLESQAKEMNTEIQITAGMCHYLKKCLTDCDCDAVLPPAALNTLLDIVESRLGETHKFILSSLVLQSPILRQFSTERSIRLINTHIDKSGNDCDPIDALALAVLYMTRERTKEAHETLAKITGPGDETLVQTLLQYWPLLLDNTKRTGKVNEWDWDSVTFSEVSVLLMEDKPRELARTLSSLITQKHKLELQNVLQVFLTYLPSRMGSGSTRVSDVLQIFLENVFICWHAQDPAWKPDPSDTPTIEALKILMRSYLGDLINKPEKHAVQEAFELDSMFGGKRLEFMDMLPPFSEPGCVKSQHTSLLKLQCLLRSGWLEESALSELVQFVSEFVDESIGLSLQVLSQPQKGIDILVEQCPAALPQYAKDVLTCENEWRHMITTLQSKIDEEASKGESGNKIYSQVLEGIYSLFNYSPTI
ncbi:hypothetical protein AAG570_002635 [Ranatra chinensis]|uniref:Hermansky-Pudlak syndrome 3 protein n=1 Tax=Ranatra chinensis TaxID=642074 RepID=A0ABD0Y860_9HEMI